MLKVVLDTNVFISSIFWQGNPYHIVRKVINKEITVFISDDIITEIKRVLSRDFELAKQEISDIIDSIAMFTYFIAPKEKIDVIKDDPTDNTILGCAIASDSKVIVSQDKHLLKLKKFRDVVILNPDEFLRILPK
ncbi:MAG: putative toxin-antitoxin system toxin component, PIN family [Nanoarchaeota archaeon]|nr:putative toxin-antitoxin system toxin component, PIN family [Nanoarchaeota archaeon]